MRYGENVIVLFLLGSLVFFSACGKKIKEDVSSRDPDERRLGVLKEKDIAVLLELLNDKDDLVRDAVVSVIGNLGKKEFCQYLLPKLSDPSPLVRGTTCYSLSKCLDERAIPKLIDIIKNDKDPLVKVKAITTLSCFNRKNAVMALIDAIADNEECVSVAAQNALIKISGRVDMPKSKSAWFNWFSENYSR